MKFAIAAAAVLACALPTAAVAQEKPAFDGIYVGAVAGLDHVILSTAGGKGSKDGLTYGVVVGYDKQIGNLVLGAEAELDGSTVKETDRDVFILGDTLSAKAGRDIYVGARIGTRVLPSTLLYAKAGYTNARVTVQYTGIPPFKVSDNLDGFRIGAGVEQSFGRFAARLEYRFSDYSEFKVSGFGTGVDAKRHQVVASLIARF